MSGRSVIWHAVAPLIAQRPLGGWGWFIGWPTDMEPFASLVIRPDGTPTNQAHNAYVEAALTTGFVGAAMITVAIVWTLYRVVKVAVAHIDDNLWDVIPAVIIIAMFLQSFTESRLLFEGNWMIVVVPDPGGNSCRSPKRTSPCGVAVFPEGLRRRSLP